MLRMKLAANTVLALVLLTAACAAGKTPVSMEKSQESYETCDTPVCMERAQQIKKSLDPCVDPCEDFYSYACGGWIRSTTIPESKSALSSFDILGTELNNELKRILENMTLVHSDDQKATDKLALAYRACVAVPEAGDQRQVMWQIMNDYGLGEWPLLGEEEHRHARDLNWTKMLVKVESSPLLSVSVGRDSKNTTRRIIELDQIDFYPVGRNQLIHPNRRQSEPIIAAYKKLIATAAKFANPNITEMQAKILAHDLVDFEGRLANLTTPPEERRDVVALYHRTSIGALQRNFSDFPLLDLLNKEFRKVNMTLSETEPLEFYAVDYYRRLTPFLREADPMTLFNYIGMKTMLQWASQASQGVRNATFELRKATTGQKRDVPRWETCVDLLNNMMSEVTGHLYVTKTFNKQAKIEVEAIVTAVKDAFNETLQKGTWMDDDTRHQATIKLEKMGNKIAYPEWLLNTTRLEEFIKYIPNLNVSTPFVWTLRSIQENNWKSMLEKLREPYERDKIWPSGAAVVNAFYSPSGNEIVFPAGILQGIFYQYGVPRALNIGAFGFVVGHEITHGFDDMGRQFDAEGRLRQWWSNSTREEFEKKAQCFVQQYGSIYNKEAEMKLNGIITLGENIADNGGIRTAFRAYEKIFKEERKGNDTRLLGLEELSGEKLFFIGNAMVWCQIHRTEYLRQRIQYKAHSPNMYRVNIPMTNFAEFSRVFNCPLHSRMNPSRNETCALW